MVGVDEVRLAFTWGEVTVERPSVRAPSPLTPVDQGLAQQFVFHLIHGAELRDPEMMQGLRGVLGLLSRDAAGRFDSGRSPLPEEREPRRLVWTIQDALESGVLELRM